MAFNMQERMAKIEERVSNLHDSMNNLDLKIDKVELRIIGHFDNTIKSFNEALNEVKKEKANKWVETLVLGLVSTVGIALVGYVLKVVIAYAK